jgi:hypothetical protein
VTALQTWWGAQLALLGDAREGLDDQGWAVFVALLTFRVAALNTQFLDEEQTP